ncbi:hypothetical protein [Bacteriovorax sp. Seq25_V]|uniref:hypothetical protein n=1 Tax=Bacteriovorax sp. Seq25_V TaxID=1201288 RepID=UPI00038A054C|nr:hypothetical protein [Bacteriovorax sp. Seq25_V]EQC44771.1 hypothetical protein M900_0319 [Bacteriovorax sp. Seq25_V]
MLNFLIRLHGTEEEMVAILPLLETIVTIQNDNRVNLILDEKSVYNSFWFKERINIFNIPEEKEKSVFGVHHFAANLHDVFNVDYFIDYVNDFHSAFIGLAFKAKKRIGLAGGPKSYFYTHSMESFSGLFPDEKKLSVLKFVEELKNSKPIKMIADTKKEYQKICVDLTRFNEELYLERIEALVSTFDEVEKYFYVPAHLEEALEEDDREIIKKLKAMGLFFQSHEDEIISKLETFDLFISSNLLFTQLAHLKGCRALLVKEMGFNLSPCGYVDSSLMILKYEGIDLVQYGIDEVKNLRVISEVYDYIINFYSLRLEPS